MEKCEFVALNNSGTTAEDISMRDTYKVRKTHNELVLKDKDTCGPRYHLHLYGDPTWIIRSGSISDLVRTGGWTVLEVEDSAVGPHPEGQIGLLGSCKEEALEFLKSWEGKYLLHPDTGDLLEDHLGEGVVSNVVLNMEYFKGVKANV